MLTERSLFPPKPRIGVLGSYGGLNTGDEAILTCVLTCLRAHSPHARLIVFSRDAEHTRTHQPLADEVLNWERVPHRPLHDALADLDLLVLGGGGVLYDGEARRYLRLVAAAQAGGMRTLAYAVGAGPLREADDLEAVRTVLSAMDDVVVRDEESRLVLEEIGVERDMTVTADPALLLPEEPFTAEMMAREVSRPLPAWWECRYESRAGRPSTWTRATTTRFSPALPTTWYGASTPTWFSYRWNGRTFATHMPSCPGWRRPTGAGS